jgi:cyclohexanecarboxyl-CoA dehydrogenase
MEFRFNKDEEDIRGAANGFARKELVDSEISMQDQVSIEIVEMVGTLGFLGLKISEDYGGVQAGWVEEGIVVEEIAKGNISIAYLIMITCEVGLILDTYGSNEAKEAWLNDICRGKKMGCISVTEPFCGSDVKDIETKATRHGDHYLLRGKKNHVSFGTQADCTILFADTDGEGGKGGLTAFLVPLDLPGITKKKVRDMGLLPTAPAQFELHNVKIPLAYRIGEVGEGDKIHRELGLASQNHRILSGLIPLGAAQSVLDMTVSYARKRFAFGRPIAQFQAISGKIAENAAMIDMGQWLCYRGLWLMDQGLPHTREAAICSWKAPKLAYRVMEDAILIHGHAGYSEDHPFQQMLRDVIAFEMVGGTEEMMKLIIARDVIGKAAVPKDLWDEIAD